MTHEEVVTEIEFAIADLPTLLKWRIINAVEDVLQTFPEGLDETPTGNTHSES